MTGKIANIPILALGALVALAGTAVVAAGQEKARDSKQNNEDSPFKIPPRCSGIHPVRGRGHKIDLVRVEAGYRELVRKLAKDLKGAEGNLQSSLDRSHDAQLPACRGNSERRVRFPNPAPLALRGRKLAFVREGGRLPGVIQRDNRAGIFIVEAKSLKTLEKLADRWARPVSLADGAFARAFFIRCAPAWIEIDSSGREGVVHEYR